MQKTLALWLSMALLAGGLSACAPRGAPRLVVGTVDTATVLQSNPKYEQRARDYLRERVDAMKKAFEDLPAGSVRVDEETGAVLVEQTAREKIMEREREISRRWAEITQEYVTAGHGAIRRAAEEICAEKGIDVVLIDSKLYPTVEFGAIDITEDVMRKLSASDTGSQRAAEEESP